MGREPSAIQIPLVGTAAALTNDQAAGSER